MPLGLGLGLIGFGAGSSGGGAPPPESSTATLNPSDKGATIVLSNGNKTAANTDGSYGSAPGVRSTIPAAAGGKHYIEFTSGQESVALGICNASVSLSDYPYTTDDAIVLYWDNGTVSFNTVDLATFSGGGAPSDVFSIVVDNVNNKIDFRKNGGAWLFSYDESDGSGGWTNTITGDLYFGIWIYGNYATTSVEVNADEWAAPAPDGFTEWGVGGGDA